MNLLYNFNSVYTLQFHSSYPAEMLLLSSQYVLLVFSSNLNFHMGGPLRQLWIHHINFRIVKDSKHK